jgi:hypothetical protein
VCHHAVSNDIKCKQHLSAPRNIDPTQPKQTCKATLLARPPVSVLGHARPQCKERECGKLEAETNMEVLAAAKFQVKRRKATTLFQHIFSPECTCPLISLRTISSVNNDACNDSTSLTTQRMAPTIFDSHRLSTMNW